VYHALVSRVAIWYGILTWYTFHHEERSKIVQSLDIESRLESYLFVLLGIAYVVWETCGNSWTKRDTQNIAMGFFVLAASFFGFMQRSNGKTSVAKSIIPLAVGWAWASNGQHTSLATHISLDPLERAMFNNRPQIYPLAGYLLAISGGIRAIEMLYCQSKSFDEARLLRQLSSLTFVIAGMMFIGATDYQLELFEELGIDRVSYFLLFASASLVHMSCTFGVHRFLLKRRRSSPLALSDECEGAKYEL